METYIVTPISDGSIEIIFENNELVVLVDIDPVVISQSGGTTDVAAAIHAAATKAPVDADEFGFWDSVGHILKKATASAIYTYLKAKFDLIYSVLTLSAVKADTDIASAISLKHSNSLDHAAHSDDQDLSGKVDKVTNKSLVLDTEIAKIHSNSLDHTQGTDQGLDYGGTNAVTAAQAKTGYTHSGAAHAPSDAVSLATVKGDTDVADAISKKHSNNLDHNVSVQFNKATAAEISALTDKATPIDTDVLLIEDSASSPTAFAKKKLTFNNLKAFLKTYFDTLYPVKSQIDFIAGLIDTVVDQDYVLVQNIPYAITITSVTTKSASGTATATFKIGSNGLGGGASSVTNTEEIIAHVTANAMAIGDDLKVTMSANSSCLGMSFTIKFTKALT